MNHVEYAPRSLLRLEKRRDRRTDRQTITDGRVDGRQTVTVHLPLDAAAKQFSILVSMPVLRP